MTARRALLLVALVAPCAAWRSCTLVGQPRFDSIVAVNDQWIVTGTNAPWVATPVPGSGNLAHETRWNPVDQWTRPGQVCAGFSGGLPQFEPQVVVDPGDGRFWFHLVADNGSGCLFASTGKDPRGPYIRRYVTAAADGLWLNPTWDKIVLTGIAVAGGPPVALVLNRADLIAEAPTVRSQTFTLDYWPHPLYNRNTHFPLPAYAFAPILGQRAVQILQWDGVPGVGAGVTVASADLALPAGFRIGEKPPDAIQPNGTVVALNSSTPGVFPDTPQGSFVYFVQAGPDRQVCLATIANLRPTFAPYVAGAYCFSGPLPDGSVGCPTLAILPGPTAEVGIVAASPTHYLSAYRLRDVGASPRWQSVYQAASPGGFNITFRHDYCTGQAAGSTACHTLTYMDGAVQGVTACAD